MTDQNEREPGALDMWKARQGVVISGIQVDRAHRTEVDLARAEVERLSSELAMSVGIVTQLDIENQRLNRDNDELRRMCEVVERIIGERDRARDLAVRAGAFEGCSIEAATLRADLQMVRSQRDEAWAERCERVAWGEEGWRLAGNNAQLIDRLTEERDQALYERDELSLVTARLSVKVDSLTAERDAVEEGIALAIYERDAAWRLYELDGEECQDKTVHEFSRGLIPTRPHDGR